MKQLSDLVGVSPRTLRYYDDIALFKPTCVGENGYRYYHEDDLLKLQQILLYRKLGMGLEQIKTITSAPDFNVLRALEEHRRELEQRLANLKDCLNTVQQTIQHLKGEKAMSQKALFKAISDEDHAAYEEEAMHKYDPQTVKSSQAKWKSYSPAKKQQVLDEGNQIYRDIVALMPQGPASPEVQACVERWRQHMAYFWVPNPEQLMGLANLYNDDPRFIANFDNFSPDLAPFMREAVSIYVASLA
ncbi:MAG: MerR family transcriptional regulator [Deinococcales bacterium]